MFLTGTMASHLIITSMMEIMVMIMMIMMMIMVMVMIMIMMVVMILPQVDSQQPSYMGFSPPEPS